jgi:hypothetical protein
MFGFATQGCRSVCPPLSFRRYLFNFIQLSCAAAQGFALLEGNSTITYLKKPLPPQDTPFTRFNDGGCDSKGRFFAGTIYNKDKGISGKLYRYDPSIGSCEIVDKGPFTVCFCYVLYLFQVPLDM